MYKIIITTILVLTLSSCASNEILPKNQENNISYKKQFNSIWNIIKSDPYDKLPQYKISYSSLEKDKNNTIFDDAKRTLNSKEDILPYFNKLVHPNGICLKGTWSITKENNYSGYFKKGSTALIIARASSALSNTKKAQIRTFGFAGKLFATTNPNEVVNQTANFFLIDDLGGTKELYYTNTQLTNAPKVSFNFEVLKNIFYALKIKNAFEKADKNPNIRQIYEISELDENKKINTPKFMKIKASKIFNKEENDFRDELKIRNKNLIFDIYVSNDKKSWQKIGVINFDQSITSISCDHRLHFSHPKYK